MAGHHSLDSSDQEDSHHLDASPTRSNKPSASGRSTKTPITQNARFETDESREAALQRELEGVRNINNVIEGVIGTLEKAKGNMGVCIPKQECYLSAHPIYG